MTQNNKLLIDCAHDKKKRVTDEERGEIICGPCGQILTEDISSYDSKSDYSLDYFLNNTQSSTKTTLTIFDKGLSTIIDAKNIDFAGRRLSPNNTLRFKSMRVWDSRSKLSSSERNTRSALMMLDGVKQKLGLTKAITEHITWIYRKASALGLVRGRGTNEIMAASIYVTCREFGIPRSLDEISDALNVTKKSVSKYYRVLITLMDIKPEIANPVDCISKFCSLLNISEKTKRHTFVILQEAITNRIVSGSKPAAVCAGALYLACMVNDEHISQQEITKQTRVSSPSIRKISKILNAKLSVAENYAKSKF